MDVPLGIDSVAGESRGVANVVGYVIIITLVLASVTIIVGLGSTALGDTMDRSEQRLAEHTMTLFDSRTAMVALGTSDSQSLSFSQDGGSAEVRPNVGTLTIKHLNYTGGGPETIFKESLGAFVYVNGDTEVAYQGGGIWRRTDDSTTRMVSPPEFHYRGATLTLPVVRVDGDRTSATSPRVTIRSAAETSRIFPSDETYGDRDAAYENPIRSGRVEITIESPYYEGWAEYARERTSADVSVYDSNQTVRLILKSLAGPPGNFDMPLEGNSVSVNGIGGGHPITDFTLNLSADGKLQNAHWSLYSNDNNNEFEMHIHSPSQCKDESYNDEIEFSLYYYNGSTDPVQVREWNNSVQPEPNSAFEVDCEEKELLVNFTNTNFKLIYTDIPVTGSNNKWCFGEHIEDRNVPVNFNLSLHPSVHEEDPFDIGDKATLNFTMNHYLSRMGTEFDLTVKDGRGNNECLSGGNGNGSGNIDESSSSGRLDFKDSSAAQYLTYLHVTENRVEITLD